MHIHSLAQHFRCLGIVHQHLTSDTCIHIPADADDHCPVCRQSPGSTPASAARKYLDNYIELDARVGRPLAVILSLGPPRVELRWDLSTPAPVLVSVWESGTSRFRDDHDGRLESAMRWYFGAVEEL